MGKRFVKIRQSQVFSRKDELTGKEADVVLNTKGTIHGYIDSVDSEKVLVNDKKDIVHKLLIVNIEEIIYDWQASH